MDRLLGQRDPVGQPEFMLPFACLWEQGTGKRYVGADDVRDFLWTPDSSQLYLFDNAQRDGALFLRVRAVRMAAAHTEEVALLPLTNDLYLPKSNVALGVATSADRSAAPAGGTTQPALPLQNGAKATAPPDPIRSARWELAGTSKDGQQIFLWLRPTPPANAKGIAEETRTLQLVNTQDGSTTSLGSLQDAACAAWWLGTDRVIQ